MEAALRFQIKIFSPVGHPHKMDADWHIYEGTRSWESKQQKIKITRKLQVTHKLYWHEPYFPSVSEGRWSARTRKLNEACDDGNLTFIRRLMKFSRPREWNASTPGKLSLFAFFDEWVAIRIEEVECFHLYLERPSFNWKSQLCLLGAISWNWGSIFTFN